MLNAKELLNAPMDSVVETTTDQLMLATSEVARTILQGSELPSYESLERQPNPNPDEPDYRAGDFPLKNGEILHAAAFYDRGHVRVNLYSTLGRKRMQRGREVFSVRSLPLAGRCTTVPDGLERGKVETLQRRCYEDAISRLNARVSAK